MSKVRSRGFEPVSEEHLKNEYKEGEEVVLPLRGTKTSAGYDFYATRDLCILPQDKVMFSTDVKAYMKPNEFLMIPIRSSLGAKKDLMISNTIGIVDSDYYDNVDNDGNMMISLRNLRPQFEVDMLNPVVCVRDMQTNKLVYLPNLKDVTNENTIFIAKGERVAQGIFIEFKESDNCNSEVERTGGVGHTNNKIEV